MFVELLPYMPLRLFALFGITLRMVRFLQYLCIEITQLISIRTQAPYEPMSLFFAALLLYVFARTQISQGSEMSPIVLDARHDEDPALWIVCGGDSSLGGIGNLASPLAPKRILQLFSQVLMQRLGQVWEIGVALGGVVGAMASREQ